MIAATLTWRLLKQFARDEAAHDGQGAVAEEADKQGVEHSLTVHRSWLSNMSKDFWDNYKKEKDATITTFDFEKMQDPRSPIIVLSGFKYELENKYKPGHIGREVGDMLSVLLPHRTERVEIAVLHSYEQNGVMRVRILEDQDESRSKSCTLEYKITEGECSRCIQIADVEHDTRWNKQTSIRQQLGVPMVRATQGCAWLQVTESH